MIYEHYSGLSAHMGEVICEGMECMSVCVYADYVLPGKSV